jgi:hypothetical protein
VEVRSSDGVRQNPSDRPSEAGIDKTCTSLIVAVNVPSPEQQPSASLADLGARPPRMGRIGLAGQALAGSGRGSAGARTPQNVATVATLGVSRKRVVGAYEGDHRGPFIPGDALPSR